MGVQDDLKVEIQNIKRSRECSICRYKKYYGALEFHHIDGDSKEFSLSNIPNVPFPDVLYEISKCAIICCNCHREYHAGQTSPDFDRVMLSVEEIIQLKKVVDEKYRMWSERDERWEKEGKQVISD